MNWIVYHVLAGHAFFLGIASLVFAGWSTVTSNSLMKRLGNFAFALGIVSIAFSSTPIPIWIYVVGFTASAFSLSRRIKTWLGFPVGYIAIAIWSIAAIIELPYHFHPTVRPVKIRHITIIGDSVTAGIESNGTTETWPNILARKHGINVLDLSQAGATTAVALSRLKGHQNITPIVIIEIGGNDLLGGTNMKTFERDLELLISQLASKDRQILMFELPLPPLAHEYGRVQRKVAWKHGVAMIPKRLFLTVLAGPKATLDIVHLSQSGHEQMASLVGQLIAPAFEQ